MKLEYNIIGIAKNSEEDLRTVYRSMAPGVFGLALSVTKSRKLAREITVETFRRVVRYAPTFDTDMSGQYWILDMCMQLSRNSLRDPAVAPSSIAKEEVDNASALLSDTLFNLDGDRGTMLVLKAATELRNVDIAQLCGYYSGSAGAEIRRGIARLADMDKNRDKKEILPELKRDIEAVCPDLYDRIGDGERTVVAHVSHEAMYLSDEVNSFSADEKEAENIAKREAGRKKKARATRLRVLAVIAGLLLIGGIVAGIIISTRSSVRPGNEEKVPPGVQFGNTINMVSAGGKVYYRGVDGGIYAVPKGSGAPELIYGGTVRELVSDGTKLFFRGEKSKIYSINTDGSGLKQLCEKSGTTLCFSGGRLYFSASDGIYSMPGEGVSDDSELTAVYLEEVEDAPSRYCIVVDEKGKVLFSGGADKGIYSVSEFAGSATLGVLYFDEVYYMTLWDGELLFDAVSMHDIELYTLDADNKKLSVVGLNYSVGNDGETVTTGEPVLSYSAAYCVYGSKLWYEGYTRNESDEKDNIGIYVIEKNSDKPRLLLGIPADGLHVSEMFTDGERLYCFYSDGKPDGKRELISYNVNDLSESMQIFALDRSAAQP